MSLVDSSPAIEWNHDLTTAVALARKARRPILIDVRQEVCSGCDRMDAESFADERVVREVLDRFIPLQLDLFRDREFTREHQVFWTPTIMVADHSGRVRYSSINFVPADELLDIMDIGEGLAAMRWRAYDRAIELFRSVDRRRPTGPLTAEAIYWIGMAAYFRDGMRSESTRPAWDEVRERFPDSIWAKRQP